MQRSILPSKWLGAMSLTLVIAAGAFVVTAFTEPPPAQQVNMEKVLRGRALVIEHACGACHGGAFTPDGENWLAGLTPARPDLEFLIGPCLFEAGAEPCFRTRPRNLTPDNRTGMGRFTERQIFNALRFGLRPGETADVEITSGTPGEGNHPVNGKYLAPPMPWAAWRHMSDEDLWAIAAYLKYGVKPVQNLVEDSDGPPDFWASAYTPDAIGTYPPASFPTTHELTPRGADVDAAQVERGRHVALTHDCGACHGGFAPERENWLAGVRAPTEEIPIGKCAVEPGTTPCFMMRPANITPDPNTGIGRYTDRQLFNALRYGLRPGTTPDVEITGNAPGQGNFPQNPDYLGPPMPWPAFRHMTDDDLHALIAYLRHGVRPVANEVQASDAPPEGWASEYTVAKIGPIPAPPFPTRNEVKR